MAETHSKGEQRHQPLTLASTDSRTTMTRASDGRPFKPYVYGGETEEPAAVTAARERHRALNAALAERLRELDARAAAEIMPDPAPGYEWRQELTCDE